MKRKSARGSCLCGAVVYEIRFPSRFCSHCHCATCRKAHGAGTATSVGIPHERFRLLAGKRRLASYSYGYSLKGRRVTSWRRFCRRCGSPLFFESTRWPGEVHVALGCLDGEPDRKPALRFYYDRKPRWVEAADSLPRYGGPTGGRRLA